MEKPDVDAAWSVVCLCAAWCGACRGYADTFRAVAAQTGAEAPRTRFAWVDVEDEADVVGDLDIQTFPTLLVAHHGAVQHFAPLAPSAESLRRLLAGLRASPGRNGPADPVAQALFDRLRLTGLFAI